MAAIARPVRSQARERDTGGTSARARNRACLQADRLGRVARPVFARARRVVVQSSATATTPGRSTSTATSARRRRRSCTAHSPYHPAELAHVRAAVDAGHSPIEYQHGVFAAYPAPGLLVGVPFTALPVVIAEWVWLGCMLAAGGLALRLAGVRDWRVYAAAAARRPGRLLALLRRGRPAADARARGLLALARPRGTSRRWRSARSSRSS